MPEPLPDDVAIAHKTGSLYDTLNDAGIVYAGDAPYVIAVMTTALPSQDLGRAFIRNISRLAYADELRFARWRQEMGIGPAAIPPDSTTTEAAPAGGTSPDVRYWSTNGTPVESSDAPTAPP